MIEDSNSTDNYSNSQFEKRPTLQDIDELANALCVEYTNHAFYKWYCKVINILGVQRVNEIRAMYSDTRQARHLFSRRASEEMKAKIARQRILDERKNHVPDKDLS